MSVVPLDLADLSSVHALSHNLVQQKQRLDVVICNAGVVRSCAQWFKPLLSTPVWIVLAKCMTD